MKLEQLLDYDKIVIQCHDNPDADAMASGYGIYTYLKDKGKDVRFVYGGSFRIQKSNLVLFQSTFQIPIEYAKELEAPDLLVTVDCYPGQNNVKSFLEERTDTAVAVIDHHQLPDGYELPELNEVHSNYGSCATIVWKLMTEAGYDVNRNQDLATALYYGLYMDTSKLQEVSHPMDKDMRDSLRVNRSHIIHFQNSNLSSEELAAVSQALAEYRYDENWKFALTGAGPCDPNILGIIGDLLIEVDKVYSCVSYCKVKDGVKISVRSCVRETRADDLAAFLAAGMGGGGGHIMKAGGLLRGEALEKVYREKFGAEEEVSQEEMAGRILLDRLEEYFGNEDILDTRFYQADVRGMKIFQKNPVHIGYACVRDLFPAGTQILVRMLEGDIEIVAEDDLCIMIGVEYEVYPSLMKNLMKNYELVDDPYEFVGEYEPTVRNTVTGEVRPLLPAAKSCISKDTSRIYARQLDKRTKIFTQWDQEKYMLGEAGDWLAVRIDDLHDIYIVKKEIFPKIYTESNSR